MVCNLQPAEQVGFYWNRRFPTELEKTEVEFEKTHKGLLKFLRQESLVTFQHHNSYFQTNDHVRLGRYEENAYLWRMMQVIGHPDTTIMELDGYNHGQMSQPAHPLLLRFIERILKAE